MARIKVTRYQGCSNIDIADAVLDLSGNILNSCGKDEKLIRLAVSIAVAAWNISLYDASDDQYAEKADANIPARLPPEYRNLLKSFMIKFIASKKEKYPEYMKGITSYRLGFDEETGLQLVVHALPVRPA